MDTTAKRRAILARLKAGEISEDEADAELERLLNPPKRGPGRPKKTGFFVRGQNGELVELRGRYRRKPSRRELEIGRHYAEQVEAGTKPMNAMRHTLKKFSTKRKPLEDSSVRRYAGLYKQHRKELAEWARQWLDLQRDFQRATDPRHVIRDALDKINPTRQLQRIQKAIDRATFDGPQYLARSYQSNIEREMRRYQAALSFQIDPVRQQIEAIESESRERIRRASESALSLVAPGFEVGQKK